MATGGAAEGRAAVPDAVEVAGAGAFDPASQLAAFRLVLGGATMLMLGLSWRLWAGASAIPRVPFLEGFGAPPLDPLAFGALVAAIVLATLLGSHPGLRGGWIARRAVPALDLISAGLLGILILADQHRFQPWAYQYLLLSLAFAASRPSRALGLGRLFAIALYVHSGLSKLDVTFARELGPAFLGVGLGYLGLEPSPWPAPVRTAAVLAMPAAELLVGVGLVFRRTRRPALVGAILIHAALIGILSPWGLGHSVIVLVWNAAMLVEVVILFGPRVSVMPANGSRNRATIAGRLVVAAFLVAAVMPLFERRGLWDTWPSFALYASHGERVEVSVAGWEAARYPLSIRGRFGPADPDGLRPLDLNTWSLAERGTPVYPQVRAMLGLAEALADGPNRPRLVVATIVGRADRFRGTRTRRTLRGLDAIRGAGDAFRLNAHPAGPPIPDPTARDMR